MNVRIDHFDLLRSLHADRSSLGMTPLLHGTLGFLKKLKICSFSKVKEIEIKILTIRNQVEGTQKSG
jgi:hypothetical protein